MAFLFGSSGVEKEVTPLEQLQIEYKELQSANLEYAKFCNGQSDKLDELQEKYEGQTQANGKLTSANLKLADAQRAKSAECERQKKTLEEQTKTLAKATGELTNMRKTCEENLKLNADMDNLHKEMEALKRTQLKKIEELKRTQLKKIETLEETQRDKLGDASNTILLQKTQLKKFAKNITAVMMKGSKRMRVEDVKVPELTDGQRDLLKKHGISVSK